MLLNSLLIISGFLFFSQLRADPNQKILEKASAWYYVCYSSSENKRLKVLSFPWILEDVLNKFNAKNYDNLSRSIVENYCENRDDYQSMLRYTKKVDLKNKINKLIDTQLVICGSFGLFLFENNNEIQLIERGDFYNEKMDFDQVKTKLEAYYDKVSVGNDLIKCQHSDDVEFTISESRNAILRFLYIRQMIFTKPILLAFLYSIVHFARADGIFSFLNTKKVKLDHYLEFCIEFCIKENFLSDISIADIEKYFDETFSSEHFKNKENAKNMPRK